MCTLQGTETQSHLDGVLELFVLSLQLLSLLERAGCDQTGVQHRLAVANPTQHLRRHADGQEYVNMFYHYAEQVKI